MEYISLASIALMGIIPYLAGKLLVSSKGGFTINWPNSSKWDRDLKIRVNLYFYRTSIYLIVMCCLATIVVSLFKYSNFVTFNKAGLILVSINAALMVSWISIFIIGMLKIIKVAQQVDAPEPASPAR
jgi:hypothetical protein